MFIIKVVRNKYSNIFILCANKLYIYIFFIVFTQKVTQKFGIVR